MKTRRRVGVQPDDIPVEVLRIVLGSLARRKERSGIRWNGDEVQCSDFRQRLVVLTAHAIASQRAPWQFHSTWGLGNRQKQRQSRLCSQTVGAWGANSGEAAPDSRVERSKT